MQINYGETGRILEERTVCLFVRFDESRYKDIHRLCRFSWIEKDAYRKALDTISRLRMDIAGARLDRYCSGQSIPDGFSENTGISIMPKKNSSIGWEKGWRDIIRRFMDDPVGYLRRSNSEAGFSSDKRPTWRMRFQRRKDRIDIS
ncbi:MAG: hypothetical protein M1162_04250 [Candidatus Thermoplasmatota archaeon]|nr:hypothetical protein [Candidatus Thermoplasmatota archaeon]